MKTCRIGGLTSPLTVLAIVALALTGGGCSSQSERVVKSFSKTREAIADAQKQVDGALLSLHALRSTPAAGLKGGFERYTDAVDDLKEGGEDARERAVVMQQEADEHVKQWQKEMETLTDPQVKATMEARREAVRTNFKLLKLYAQDARQAYGPYLAGNQEIVRALTIDLSPAAVSALSPSIDRVLLNGKAVQEKLFLMQNALDNMAAGVSPLGAAPINEFRLTRAQPRTGSQSSQK